MSETVRYRAASRVSYAAALLALVIYAREHRTDFVFGPMDLAAVERHGIAVSGDRLDGVRAELAKIPGLIPE